MEQYIQSTHSIEGVIVIERIWTEIFLQEYSDLCDKLKTISHLEGVSGLLGWDELVRRVSALPPPVVHSRCWPSIQCPDHVGCPVGDATGGRR